MGKDPRETLSPRPRAAITAGVMTGMLLAALEATVAGTAMPTVIAALVGMKHYSWVFSAHVLTSTVTVPIWGKLSDGAVRRNRAETRRAEARRSTGRDETYVSPPHHIHGFFQIGQAKVNVRFGSDSIASLSSAVINAARSRRS